MFYRVAKCVNAPTANRNAVTLLLVVLFIVILALRGTPPAIEPHLQFLHLRKGDVLAETGDTISQVYHPHQGIISCVVEMIGGGATGTGMIGKDGKVGAALMLDDCLSLNYAVVQVEGGCSTPMRTSK